MTVALVQVRDDMPAEYFLQGMKDEVDSKILKRKRKHFALGLWKIG